MDEETVFLERIGDGAEEWSARLLYADWLEERGEDKRADYLRIECELGALDDGHPSYSALEAQLAELRRSLPHDWIERAGMRYCICLTELPPLLKSDLLNPLYRLLNISRHDELDGGRKLLRPNLSRAAAETMRITLRRFATVRIRPQSEVTLLQTSDS